MSEWLRRWPRKRLALVSIGVCVILTYFLNRTFARPVSEPVRTVDWTRADWAPISPAYALPPLDPSAYVNGPSVERAVSFLEGLQPEGTYILSQPDDNTIVPMDVAHAAIALVKVRQNDRAKAAMTWLYQQMIRTDSRGADFRNDVTYVGSWDDRLRPGGGTAAGSGRGRGEAVGMSLIATYAVASVDPGFLGVSVGGEHVSDLVRKSVAYLTQPSMQNQDGSFAHSPTYSVAFDEECARMSLGLELASRMLTQVGDVTSTQRAALAADAGLWALKQRGGMSQGMAYDYVAMGIWGLGTRSDARSELTWLKSTGLVGSAGVRNWDWQINRASSAITWLRWWVQAQTISPSETFDYAIACVTAGDIGTALEIERRWLPLQRKDGGFADAYLFGLRVGVSPPTSYAVARFLLLERLLADVAPE